MMLGDRPADLDDGSFLKRIGADHRGTDLARDGHERNRVHLGIRQAGDQVGGARPAGRHAHPDPAAAPRIALGGKAAALLVPRQDGAQP